MDRVARRGSQKIDTISRLRPMRQPSRDKNNRFFGIPGTDISRGGGGGQNVSQENIDLCFFA